MNDSSSTRSTEKHASPLEPRETPPADDSFATVPPGDELLPVGQPEPRRYEFQSTLGQGGMGVVYRVLDRSLGRVVALKVIRADALTPALRARFAEEARAVALLNHPHIVQVFDVGEIVPPGEVAPVPFLTLEYVERGSLAGSLAKDQPLAPTLAAQLVTRIARGMQHAHDRGIVHRDLKPENVLLAAPGDVAALNTPMGCPKVTDFGLARLMQADRRLTQSRTLMGTPAYMAPEQAEGLPDVGPPADVYSLGVILYRLLTGKVPFGSTSITQMLYQVCHEIPVPPRQARADIPEELDRLCVHCLEKDPRKRPTMGEIASGIERWLEGLAQDETVPLVAPRKRRAGRRAVLLGGLFGVMALALGGVGLFGLKPKEGGQPEERPPATGAVPVAHSLRIKPIRVTHYATVGKEEEPRGRIGEKSFTAHVGDGVTLAVELSGPGYLYLVGFNFDGKEQLLWPVDAQGEPSDAVRPPQGDRVRYPAGGARLGLDDDYKGGLQAYVVVASAEPLPEYRAWRAGRTGVNWKALPAGKAVWEADEKGTYACGGGLLADRASVRKALGTPPLDDLCRALGAEGMAVEAFAFGVLAKEGK